jgi:putative acyl-CoA dehydrogenase
MALALQGAVLAKHAPDFVADAFCATRLAEHPGLSYGALDAKIDTDALIQRAMPRV